MGMANTDQAAAWNGPEGTNWADFAERSSAVDDALIVPLLSAAAIENGDRVVDVGCGTGEMTRLAARRARGGRAVGVDLSAQMIDRARAAAAAAGPGNASFDVGDAEVYPFARQGFDVAISHFGAMFFGDPVRAFANIARALRLGGRLAFVCPQEMNRCDWYLIPLTALLRRAPSPATAPSQMFSLADPRRVEDVLGRAGFVDVHVEAIERSLRFGDDANAAAAFFVDSGPAASVLERTPDLSRAHALELLQAALTPLETDDGVRIPGHHWLVTAAAPPSTSPARP
jgi:SAM-dependent methyltransferase